MTQVVDASSDMTYRIYMQTTAVHIYRAVTDYSYTPADGSTPDKLELISYLERDGSIITGVVYLDVKIYEGSALFHQMPEIGTDPRIFDGEGEFIGCTEGLSRITDDQGLIFPAAPWTDTGLTSGKVYTIVTTALIGSCGKFTTPVTLSVTDVQALSDMKEQIDSKLDK